MGGDEIELGPQSLADTGVITPLEVEKRDFLIAQDALDNARVILGVQIKGLSRTIEDLLVLPSASLLAGGTSWRFGLVFLPLLLLTFFLTAGSGPLVSGVRVSALPLLLLRILLLASARFPIRIPELPGQVLVLLAKLDRALHSSEILLAEQRNTRVELLSCGLLLGHAESLESSCLPATDNISMQVQNILRFKFEQ